MKRFELRNGKFGPYFHDRERGGKDGYDMSLDDILEKLNRLEEYTQRLAQQSLTGVKGMSLLDPSPLDALAGTDCVCSMGDSCCCPPAERALRRSIEADDIVFTADQRAWCLNEIEQVEGYRREDYADVVTSDLARGVLDAWRDYCRDKGLI